MKLIFASIFFALFCVGVQASITLNFTLRGAYDSTGSALVADNTLWALIIDDGGVENALTGITLGGNGGSIYNNGTASVFTSGQSLSVGQSIGTGTVFAMGGFNGTPDATGAFQMAIDIPALGSNGLVAGRSYGVYWFSGATYTGALTSGARYTLGAHTQAIGSQVGGIVNTRNDVSSTYGNMVMPTDGSIVSQGARSTTTTPWALSDFRSVTLIPEPTVSLLGLLTGGLLLMRRRRTV